MGYIRKSLCFYLKQDGEFQQNGGSLVKKAKISVCVLVLAWAGAHAQEDYSTWAERRDITINTTNTSNGANVTTTQNNFPVLVRLTSAQASAFVATNAQASVRFTAADGVTRLKHQTERFDAAGQLAEFWVRVPAVTGNATTTIRFYVGKAGAVDSSSGPAVFDTASRFRGVWHLGETATPSEDATVFATNADWKVGITAGTQTTATGFSATGLIGKAVNLNQPANGGTLTNATVLYLRAPYNVSNNNFKTNKTSGLTLSAWVNRTSSTNNNEQGLIGRYNWGINNRQAFLATNNSSVFKLFRGITGTTTGEANFGTGTVTSSTWQYVVGTVRNGQQVIYHNGVANTTQTTAEISSLDSTWAGAAVCIGQMACDHTTGVPQAWRGLIDEARFSDTARTADWVKLEYETQKAPTDPAVVTVGGLVTGVSARVAPSAMLSMRSSGSGFVFSLPAQEGVRISVLDVHGREVWTRAAEGKTEVLWNGQSANGARLAAGAYVARAIAREGGSAKVLAQRSFSLM